MPDEIYYDIMGRNGGYMIKIATVFSGIGAIEYGLEKANIEHKIVFSCDNGERDLKIDEEEILSQVRGLSNIESKKIIDRLYDETKKKNFVQQSYLANYNLDPSHFYQDARFLKGEEYKGQVDLFVGGSPCQSFSMNGHRKGLEDTRGTLFYDYARLIDEIQPKVFIYENVPGILSHDNGDTFEVITSIFNDLNYNWRMDTLNARDFGIPQNRKRVFIVGFRRDLQIDDFNFPVCKELTTTVSDYLEKEVNEKYYYGEKGFKWITKDSSLKRRVSINSDIARTQSANQQFNWCGDMVFYPIAEKKWTLKDDRIYKGTFQDIVGVARKLTPREVLKLMGYGEDFKIVVPDTQLYRQSGNSIVVNVLQALVQSICDTGVFGGNNA